MAYAQRLHIQVGAAAVVDEACNATTVLGINDVPGSDEHDSSKMQFKMPGGLVPCLQRVVAENESMGKYTCTAVYSMTNCIWLYVTGHQTKLV